MIALLIFAAGLTGAAVALVICALHRTKPIGDLRIIHDEDGHHLFLELHCEVNQVGDMDSVILNVVKQEFTHN